MSKATPDMYYLRNVLTGMSRESRDQVATALALSPHVPILTVDARDRESVKQALIRVTEYSLQRLT